MRKFKLIKEYPGSPKLGSIYILDEQYAGEYYRSGFNTLYKDRIESQPEFWEEVIEIKKDYEILSFIGIGWIDGHLFPKETNGHEFERYLEESHKNIVKIHSIKRLSDGEVFTIGDKCIQGKIAQIQLDIVKGLWIDFENPSHGGYINISIIQKAKIPILITEDGAEIFEGDKYYFVPINKKSGWSEWKIVTDTAVKDKDHSDSNNWKDFSTKQAAEDYIMYNKPCLSINEINITINSSLHGLSKLKELVKSKL